MSQEIVVDAYLTVRERLTYRWAPGPASGMHGVVAVSQTRPNVIPDRSVVVKVRLKLPASVFDVHLDAGVVEVHEDDVIRPSVEVVGGSGE